MSRSVRNHLIAFAIILAVVATPFLVPLSVYRPALERAASVALAREVHIKGPVHLTVYPGIGLSLSDVAIANVPGARDTEMIAAEDLVVGAKLMPLFSGRLDVTELTLRKPKIHLEVERGGKANWTFGDQSGSGN